MVSRYIEIMHQYYHSLNVSGVPQTLPITGLPAVITLSAYGPDITTDDVPIPEACRRLENARATVVGLDCVRGPDTMLPLMREIRKVCEVNWIVRIHIY